MAASLPMPDPSTIPKLYSLLQDSPVRVLTCNGYSILYIANHDEGGQYRLTWVISHDNSRILPPVSTPTTKREYQDLVKDWNDPELKEIIRLTDNDSINFMWMYKQGQCSSSNPSVTTARVALLGDAVHAMTSHMGLGANTALADAFDLADKLSQVNNMAEVDEQILAGVVSQYNARVVSRGLNNSNASLRSSGMCHMQGWKGYLRIKMMSAMGYAMSWFK
eukprot:TRINITY_DN7817_c0_g1_i1.p1 TRINITY_DN7817_c0_g1~~TRINITY_DN7817_c0_g1_i1.p1  ORF type:complete len:221 (+),score=46.45 TRINITY_DN7817_c0_g1_i1:623-1285(+)